MEFSFCEKHTKKEPQLLYLLKFLSFVWGDDVPPPGALPFTLYYILSNMLSINFNAAPYAAAFNLYFPVRR